MGAVEAFIEQQRQELLHTVILSGVIYLGQNTGPPDPSHDHLLTAMLYFMLSLLLVAVSVWLRQRFGLVTDDELSREQQSKKSVTVTSRWHPLLYAIVASLQFFGTYVTTARFSAEALNWLKLHWQGGSLMENLFVFVAVLFVQVVRFSVWIRFTLKAD